MQYIDLLGALNGGNDLDVFVKQFFAVVAASKVEERESSNYVDGRYFRGRVGDASFTVSLADYDGNEDLPFWVHIKSDTPDLETFTSMIDELIRNKAMPSGFHFALILNFGAHDAHRVDY
jgi:hypothetical protein